jgi:hypothetical protein
MLQVQPSRRCEVAEDFLSQPSRPDALIHASFWITDTIESNSACSLFILHYSRPFFNPKHYGPEVFSMSAEVGLDHRSHCSMQSVTRYGPCFFLIQTFMFSLSITSTFRSTCENAVPQPWPSAVQISDQGHLVVHHRLELEEKEWTDHIFYPLLGLGRV